MDTYTKELEKLTHGRNFFPHTQNMPVLPGKRDANEINKFGIASASWQRPNSSVTENLHGSD